MTEEKWLRCADSDEVGEIFQRWATDRQLRLFACASARRFWIDCDDPRCQRAIEVSERFADGIAIEEERAAAEREASDAYREVFGRHSNILEYPINGPAYIATLRQVPFTAVLHVGRRAARDRDRGQRDGEAADAAESRIQVFLLRHIFGNPFRPHPPLPHVPSTVRELAELAYQKNQVVVGPLHDALLDAGLAELAEHFAAGEEGHPKGCWALDALTGRT